MLGPGHWWPYAIIPVYWVMEMLPSTRESARRLGLVTIRQVLNSVSLGGRKSARTASHPRRPGNPAKVEQQGAAVFGKPCRLPSGPYQSVFKYSNNSCFALGERSVP